MSTRSNGKNASTPRAAHESGHVVEMQRRRLLLAIVEVVGQEGMEAATVGRVCEQAGVSRRTFYELFAGREECLLAALEAQVERIGALLAPVYGGAGRWEERVRNALCRLLELLDAEPDVARLCVVETLRAGPAVLERRRQVIERIAAAVDEGRAAARAGSEPPPLTAQGVVGGVVSVIHTRLLAAMPDRPSGDGAVDGPVSDSAPLALVELAGPLMAMIVHPYLGAAAARRQLQRPALSAPARAPRHGPDPFRGLPIRFTYRTARVLSTIASDPGASNRHIADCSGIADDGQMSRLLARLCRYGLVENEGEGHAKGEANAWTLTDRGAAIQATIARAASA